MATQKGVIKLSGKLGDLIFYQGQKKGLVRKANSTTKPHQSSEASKQSAQDFGEISKTAKYIRTAFAPLIEKYGDRNLVNRLNVRISEIFKTISSERRGFKKLRDGNISLLAGFEINGHTAMANLYYQLPIITVSPDGVLNIHLPKGEIDALFSTSVPNTTKVCLNLMIFSFDLKDEQFEIFRMKELQISLQEYFAGGSPAEEIKIDCVGEKAILVALGIHYEDAYGKIKDHKNYGCQITNVYHLEEGFVVKFIALSVNKITKKDEETGMGLNWKIG